MSREFRCSAATNSDANHLARFFAVSFHPGNQVTTAVHLEMESGTSMPTEQPYGV